MRSAAIALLLGACGGDGASNPCITNTCCLCDAAAPIDVEGDLTLREMAYSQSCPTPVARDPLILTVVDGPEKTVTAASPIVVTSSGIDETVDYARVTVDLTDTWGSDTVELHYPLWLTRDGKISGIATGVYGGGACRLLVAIDGTYNGP